MRAKRLLLVGLLLVVVGGGTACAAANIVQSPEGAGFWRGLGQGIIAPVTFVISLFRDDVAMYEVHNNGGWYNLGFLIGVGFWHGGGGAAVSRRRRRQRDDDANDTPAR